MGKIILVTIILFMVIYQFIKIKECKDIIKKLNEKNSELKEENEKIIKSNESIKDIFAEISHDIRTPISNIICLSRIIKDNLNNEEKVIKYLTKIDGSAKYLLGLSNDVLNMRKLEKGNIELNNEAINIKDVMLSCFSIVENKMYEKEIKFSKNIDKLKHIYLYGDELRLHQVFTNILSNAINHTPKGGKITFQAKELYYEEDKVEVQFKISDNGEGMRKEFLKHIWEAYARDENSYSQKDSTGLGLAITKQYVTLMNGTIDVESKIGQGSTFIVRIKFDVNHDNNKKKEKLKKKTIKDMKVLLADDNDANREIVKYFLEEHHIKVETASNGKIAYEKIKKSSEKEYNLILMDVKMPEMDGLEATKLVRSLERKEIREIPIIGMTASMDAKDFEKMKLVGMNKYLMKPMDMDLLIKEMLLYK